MTDERMHARLHEAGERWRAAHDAVAEVDSQDELPLQRGKDGRRRARRAATLVSVAAIALVAIAAGMWLSLRPGGGSQAATARLTGTVWKLTGLTGMPMRYAGYPHDVRLTVSNGQIVGDDGCNTFSGPVQVGAGTLRVHDLAVTAMACESGQLPIENYFTGTVSWSIAGDTLTITKAAVGTLTYRAPKAGSPDDLIDRTWVLQGIQNPTGDFGWSGPTPAPPTRAVRFRPVTDSTLFIDAHGNLTADTRCGEYTARVAISIRDFTVRARSYVPHSCPAPVRGNEYAQDLATLTLRAALAGSVPWRIDGAVLEIGPAKGPTLQYRAQTSQPPASATPTAVPSVTASASPGGADALVSRTWYLAGISEAPAGKGAYSSTLGVSFSGSVPQLRIQPDGSFTAAVSDCAAYHGRAVLNATSLTVTARSFIPACALPRPNKPLLGLLGRVLTGTVAWRVDGGTLALTAHRITIRYTDQPPSITASAS